MSASYSNAIKLRLLLYSIQFIMIWVVIFKGPTESLSAILPSVSWNDFFITEEVVHQCCCVSFFFFCSCIND